MQPIITVINQRAVTTSRGVAAAAPPDVLPEWIPARWRPRIVTFWCAKVIFMCAKVIFLCAQVTFLCAVEIEKTLRL